MAFHEVVLGSRPKLRVQCYEYTLLLRKQGCGLPWILVGAKKIWKMSLDGDVFKFPSGLNAYRSGKSVFGSREILQNWKRGNQNYGIHNITFKDVTAPWPMHHAEYSVPSRAALPASTTSTLGAERKLECRGEW